MTDLSDFGAGLSKTAETMAETPDDPETAKHRRAGYQRAGRCRAIATSQGTRCAAGAHGYAVHQFCHYHNLEFEPVTIDSKGGVLARWCGTEPTEWEDIPDVCRKALERAESEVDRA